MKTSVIRILLLLQVLQAGAFAGNSVVNLSHYDLMRPDFARMKADGIVGVIHEATYPPSVRDSYYGTRQNAATRAGLLWGAYHFANATDPIRQAEFFLNTVASQWRGPALRPNGVLLVLDFEKNGHYPGGSMRVDQAVTFVERIHQRTGRYPGLYCSEYRLREMLFNPRVTAAQRRTLASCWLWIANYHFVPRNTAPFSHWTMWQYTGDGVCDLPRASYPKGIANIKHAERNMFRGSAAALQAFWQEHAWNPAE
jgi:lysozyme